VRLALWLGERTARNVRLTEPEVGEAIVLVGRSYWWATREKRDHRNH